MREYKVLGGGFSIYEYLSPVSKRFIMPNSTIFTSIHGGKWMDSTYYPQLITVYDSLGRFINYLTPESFKEIETILELKQ